MQETWPETLKAVVTRPMWWPEIYSGVVRRRELAPYHLEPWKEKRQPRYQCWCRSAMNVLVKRGEIRQLPDKRYSPT